MSSCSHAESLADCTQWLVGRGAIKFWTDNWLGEVLVGPLPSDNNLTIAEAWPQFADLLQIIPQEWHEKMKKITLEMNKPDRLIFTLTQSGEFSSKEYWRHINMPRLRVSWTTRIWQPYLPHRTSGFLWKLIHHALPVDQRIISRGIPLASRCVCCQSPCPEDIAHLFLHSEIAVRVWKHFGSLFQVQDRFESPKHALCVWVPRPSDLSLYAMIRNSVVCHIFREIWNARCRVVYADGDMSSAEIIRKVYYHTQSMVALHRPRQFSTKIQSLRIQAAGLPVVQPPHKRGAWHKWEFPLAGKYTLNTDGSAKGGMSSGGGIIRDSRGNIVAAYSSFFGHGTNNSAEFLAIVYGLRMCRHMGILHVTMESDSLLAINAIKTKVVTWELEYILRLCLQEVDSSFQFKHVVRQKNTVADRLANWAYNHQSSQEYFTEISLPVEVRAALISDRLGIANFRP
ncbi:PREDICTED: uncharacterized protein LOC105967963 [Erythranthe guttata]|uniref:uncharacterized protein LOC105967963 n=1 Tax=Erythranthe guttata TaxID=4155 RepID=UPI00064DCD9F|nr:PREDICTED: uncharacterized protein LOC105967963 [Erythranthe guttata]|eukprot:XP_012848003.1 PREDICTED: uncharacterized protein LOC105967963 [Erythranthe guttata]